MSKAEIVQLLLNCDGRRIAQLFSNLLGNALTHNRKDTPVNVNAVSADGQFVLSVSNLGNKIPAYPANAGEIR